MARCRAAFAFVSVVVGCGGATAASSRDASTDAPLADAPGGGDAAAVSSEADVLPPLINDASPPEAAAYVDATPFPPFDASLPALPVCEAGSYFVTVDDGTGVRTLTGAGWTSAGCDVDASPSVGLAGCGNLCEYGFVSACGGGVALVLSMNVGGPPSSSATSFGPDLFGSYDDGKDASFLMGGGMIVFSAPPFNASSYGSTAAGSYTQNLLQQGVVVGSIAGTFCVLDEY
jgi:hypothetical protein